MADCSVPFAFVVVVIVGLFVIDCWRTKCG
jgi:hypothetical protein